MAQLLACPFCRQMFAEGEVKTCPECDVKVVPMADLPPSLDAQAEDSEPPPPPEDEVHAWTYAGRARGPLIMVALCGIGVFFGPWLTERAPEIRTLSGFAFAREVPWLWAAGVAWFVMLALVLSRRTIRQMRGARLAVALMAVMVFSTVLMRVILAPKSHPLLPRRFAWGWGLYTAGFLSVIALGLAARFGGLLEDMPTKRARKGDETVH